MTTKLVSYSDIVIIYAQFVKNRIDNTMLHGVAHIVIKLAEEVKPEGKEKLGVELT